MPKLPTEPMTVVSLTVDAFKRIRAAHVHPTKTGLVPVRGRNRQGKTSLIQSMQAALEGKRAAPEAPITVGEHSGEIVVDLGEIVVRKKYTRGATGEPRASLEVLGADGSPFASPQAILDALVGKFADPIAFLEMKPEEQVKTVLSVLGLDGKLAALERDAKELFDRRRDLGRDADRTRKAWDTMAATSQSAPSIPAELHEVVYDNGRVRTSTELLELLDSAQVLNEERAAVERNLSRIEAEGKDVQQRIVQLGKELERAQARRKELLVEWEAQRARLDSNLPPVVDVAPFKEALAVLSEFDKDRARSEALAKCEQEAITAAAVHADAEEKLTAKRAQITELLAGVEFPVAGMSYDADKKQLFINGVPFHEASQAEAIEVAAYVAMAGSPMVKVMFARNGSLLDADSTARLATMAAQHGFQLWLEIVDDQVEGPGIYIEDGEAFGPMVAPADEVAR